MSKPEITLFRVRSAQIGYGRMGVHLGEEIEKQGVTVYDNVADAPNTYVLDDKSAYEAFGGEPRSGLTNVVAWASVPAHARGWWKGQTPVLFTMYETGHLPASFRENFHEFDTLIVPSKQNLELFSEYHPNVKYVPLGVDPAQWFYTPRKTPTTRFNFLVGGRGQRKGTDLVYNAFRKVFPEGSWKPDQPVPYLIMKAPRPEGAYYGDRIEHVTGYIPADAEVDLYASAHCYVGPARGEGFGLQPLQAIVQGCPTILTGAHGHEAFAQYGMPLESKMVKAGAFVYGDSGVWWEPDFDQLCEYMRYVYENYAEAVERAAVNGVAAGKQFTWANTADQFLDAVGRDRLTPLDSKGKWYEPVGKLYRVVLLNDHKADIGGNITAFEKGEEYRVSGDVKRILFDAGLVDVAKSETPVIDANGNEVWDAGDHGLLPEQLEKLPGLLRRQQFCPTCHQKYGSGIDLTDVVMKEEDAKWGR